MYVGKALTCQRLESMSGYKYGMVRSFRKSNHETLIDLFH